MQVIPSNKLQNPSFQMNLVCAKGAKKAYIEGLQDYRRLDPIKEYKNLQKAVKELTDGYDGTILLSKPKEIETYQGLNVSLKTKKGILGPSKYPVLIRDLISDKAIIDHMHRFMTKEPTKKHQFNGAVTHLVEKIVNIISNGGPIRKNNKFAPLYHKLTGMDETIEWQKQMRQPCFKKYRGPE